jgi:hypothetical protein
MWLLHSVARDQDNTSRPRTRSQPIEHSRFARLRLAACSRTAKSTADWLRQNWYTLFSACVSR